MGGLRKLMPVTAATFVVGWLSIAGVPPFSGFWSKDEILLSAWASPGGQGKVLWGIGLVTALTAFYMSRQVYLVFFGKPRWAEGDEPAATESGAGADTGARAAGRRAAGTASHTSRRPRPPARGAGRAGLRGRRSSTCPSPATCTSSSTGSNRWSGRTSCRSTWPPPPRWAWRRWRCSPPRRHRRGHGGLPAAWRRARAVEPDLLAHAYHYDEAVSAFVAGPGTRGFEAVA